jgi:hypothetical protein
VHLFNDVQWLEHWISGDPEADLSKLLEGSPRPTSKDFAKSTGTLLDTAPAGDLPVAARSLRDADVRVRMCSL